MSTDLFRKCSKCGITPYQDETNNKLQTFHRFPKPGKRNILRATAWATYCWPDQDSWSLESLKKLFTSNKVLCKKHFEASCFTDVNGTRLSKYSVPGEKHYVIQLMASLRRKMKLEAEKSAVQQVGFAVQTSQASAHLNKEDPSTSQHESAVQQVGFAVQTLQASAHLNKEDPSTSQHEDKNVTLKKTKTGILTSVNVKKSNELNNREQILYAKCRRYTKELSRLRKKLKHKKKADYIKTLHDNEFVKKFTDLNISSSFAVLLQSQLRNWPKKPKARRYNLDMKIMALTIFKKSPACYRLLRRMFSLPSQSTLNNLLNRVPLDAGINDHIFASLKKMTERQMDDQNIAILSFDEMAIRKHLQYNERKDHIEGFQDHGNHGRSNVVACNALVFMLAGIRAKWKQPIAFYFSGKSFTSDRLSVIIKEVLSECIKRGLKVVATVCDMSRVNTKALDKLGSSTNEPYIVVDGHEIVTIFDPPHLLKCFRNLLMKYDVECTTNVQVDGGIVKGEAKWSHVRAFYEMDKINQNFVYAPALTEHHLNPNSKQKMRVKLAAQVFSHSVTAGILSKIASGELPAEAHATATMLNKFDELFDSLNADSPDLRGGKKHSTNMTCHSPHLSLFKYMNEFIRTLKFKGLRTPPPSQAGWIHTMNAVERLWKNLTALKINSIATRRLNQDPLENCFGCIRYHCGSNDNPTIMQFVSGIKTAIISNLRHTGRKTNCEADTAVLNDNLNRFLLPDSDHSKKQPEPKSTENMLIDIHLDEVLIDATDAVNHATPEAQACAYVCGFIFKKLKSNKCAHCMKSFLSDFTYEPIHMFTSFREYSNLSNSLTYVHKNYVYCVETCATLLNNFLVQESWTENIKEKVVHMLSQVDYGFIVCEEHRFENIMHIKNSVFHIVIKRYVTLKNREFAEAYRAKSLENKMRILKNK